MESRNFTFTFKKLKSFIPSLKKKKGLNYQENIYRTNHILRQETGYGEGSLDVPRWDSLGQVT